MNKRFTDEQIIGFLSEADMGVPVRQLCSKHGFSESSYYQWRARLVAGKPSLAQRLEALESENTQLKQLLADAMLETTPARALSDRGRVRSMKDPRSSRFGSQAMLAWIYQGESQDADLLEWPELMPFPESPADLPAHRQGTVKEMKLTA